MLTLGAQFDVSVLQLLIYYLMLAVYISLELYVVQNY